MKSVTIFASRQARRYSTYVETSKGLVRVEFDPVVMWGRIVESIYATEKEEVVEALKKHPHYGVVFNIRKEGEVDDAPVEKVAPSNNPKDYLAKDKPVIEEETVTSAATASLWLQKEKGEVFESTKVAEMKIEAAKKWNIIFKNWK